MPQPTKTVMIVVVILFCLAGGFFVYLKQPAQPPSQTQPSFLPQPQPQSQPPPHPQQAAALKDDALLKQKIGQMLMIGFRGTEITTTSSIVKVMQDLEVGGVILFDFDMPSQSSPRNILNPEQTKQLIADLQKYSPISLLVAVDAEGGKINRLKPDYGFFEIASPAEMGRDASLETTRKEAEKLAQQLKELGFNINFAPVVDLNINPANPVIGGLNRSFSSSADEVFLHAQAFIEAHQAEGIVSVVKHFPGHGSSAADSHLGLVDITETYQEEELAPYQKLQQAGLLQAVMTAHVMNRQIDAEYPATLSPLFIQDILRRQIGFDGVVISDDMQMGAITEHFGFKEAIIKAINAGCDIILLSNNSQAPYNEQLPYQAVEVIFQAVKDGKIAEERITEAANRITALKKLVGI